MSENGIVIGGTAGSPVRDVTFRVTDPARPSSPQSKPAPGLKISELDPNSCALAALVKGG